MISSRRSFLHKTIALAGCAVALRASHVLAEEPRRFGQFRMGMASYTLRSFPLDRAIEIMQSLGIETVDLNPRHLAHTVSNEAADSAKQKIADHRLTLLSYGVVGDFSKDHEKNERIFKFVKRMGARNITANPPENSLDSLEKLVAQYDIRIAIHNHGPGSGYDQMAEVMTAVKNRHPNMGACADLGHYLRSGEDPARCISLLGDRLYGVHLKDFDAAKKDAKGRILGKGILDVSSVFKALKQVNFPADACLSLEYEQNPKDPIADIKQCLEVAAVAARQAS
jgi:inosose dehydratase